MEILFKCDYRFYYIVNGSLRSSVLWTCPQSLDDVKHLDDVDIIYHIKDSVYNQGFPIYFKLDRNVIYKNGLKEYHVWHLNDKEIQNIDYTEVNIKKILDGNII